MLWVCIIFLLCMFIGCYVAYKEAKVHELHKMRAAFEHKIHDVERLVKNEVVKENFSAEEKLRGEIVGLEDAIKILEKEGVDEDLIDEIKKDLEELKEKIEKLFEKS